MKLSKQYQLMLDRKQPTELENKELIKKLLSGDEDAAWSLVVGNCRMVKRVMNNFSENQCNDEMFSEGLYGFHSAVKNLKKDVDIPCLLRYCYKYINGYIEHRLRKINKWEERCIELLESPDGEEMQRNDVIYEDIIRNESKNPHDIVCENDKKRFIIKFLKNIFKENNEEIKLTENHKKIIISLLKNGGVLSVAAKELGVTRQCIYINKDKILYRFNKYLEKNKDIARELEVYSI